MRLSKERYSGSGVAKMSTSQNINVLSKKLTPLLAVQTFSEGTRAERGVTTVGLVLAVGVYPGM